MILHAVLFMVATKVDELWLRYQLVVEPRRLLAYRQQFGQMISIEGDTKTCTNPSSHSQLQAAAEELKHGLTSMLGLNFSVTICNNSRSSVRSGLVLSVGSINDLVKRVSALRQLLKDQFKCSSAAHPAAYMVTSVCSHSYSVEHRSKT